MTATEFSLLRYLMLNPRRVLSKSQILQKVWGYDFGGNSNVVETYVSYLRRKLDAPFWSPPSQRTRRCGSSSSIERIAREDAEHPLARGFFRGCPREGKRPPPGAER